MTPEVVGMDGLWSSSHAAFSRRETCSFVVYKESGVVSR
jgi:hypothetical protein